ncbi:MAG: hypothetical protein IT373_36695 [Polyangiaceae bacterium]|nr:hypothetical protein [Polyangiaceae bacterium]
MSIKYWWTRFDREAVKAGDSNALFAMVTPYRLQARHVCGDPAQLRALAVGKSRWLDIKLSKAYQTFVQVPFHLGDPGWVWNSIDATLLNAFPGGTVADLCTYLARSGDPRYPPEKYDWTKLSAGARDTLVNMLVNYWENSKYRNAVIEATCTAPDAEKLFGCLPDKTVSSGFDKVPAAVGDCKLEWVLTKAPTVAEVPTAPGANHKSLDEAEFDILMRQADGLRDRALRTLALVKRAEELQQARFCVVAQLEAIRVLARECAAESADPDEKLFVRRAEDVAGRARTLAFETPTADFRVLVTGSEHDGDYYEELVAYDVRAEIDALCAELNFLLFDSGEEFPARSHQVPLADLDFSGFGRLCHDVFDAALSAQLAATPKYLELRVKLVDAALWALEALSHWHGDSADAQGADAILAPANLPSAPASHAGQLPAGSAALRTIIALAGPAASAIPDGTRTASAVTNDWNGVSYRADSLVGALQIAAAAWKLPEAAKSAQVGGTNRALLALGQQILASAHASLDGALAAELKEAFTAGDMKKLAALSKPLLKGLGGAHPPPAFEGPMYLLSFLGLICGVASIHEDAAGGKVVLLSRAKGTLDAVAFTATTGQFIVQSIAALAKSENAWKSAAGFVGRVAAIAGVITSFVKLLFDLKWPNALEFGGSVCFAAAALTQGFAALDQTSGAVALTTTAARGAMVLNWVGLSLLLIGVAIYFATQEEEEAQAMPNRLAACLLEQVAKTPFFLWLLSVDDFKRDYDNLQGAIRYHQLSLAAPGAFDTLRSAGIPPWAIRLVSRSEHEFVPKV